MHPFPLACRRAAILVVLFLSVGRPSPAQENVPPKYPGKVSKWNDFERHDFRLHERNAIVVVPDEVAPGNPWIWRARFFGHRPEVDLALLKHGFHLVYCDVADLFGSPQAVAHWDRCYQTLTEEYHLADKMILEGMSRGGLIVFNWTATYPERVSCIYADAPVCDMKSWPGGRGVGKGSPPTWQRMLKAYEFESDQRALQWTRNPIDQADKLAKTGIPLFVVTGDADDIVPMQENIEPLIEAWKRHKSPLEVVIKPGIGHKHGLDDPQPLIDFLLKHSIHTPAVP